MALTNYVRGIIEKGNMKSKRTFHCKLCLGLPGKGHPEYSTISELRTHQWKDHRSHYENVGGNLHKPGKTLGNLLSSTGVKCTMCDGLLKNEASLKTHMRGVHGVFKRAQVAPVNGNGKRHETEPEPDKSLYAVQVEGLVEIAQMIRDLSEERKSK